MAMTTNVPQPTFGPVGFTAPAESAILAGFLADLNKAFGGNLNLSLTTPQGQIASSEAAITGNINDLFVFLTNMFDPAFASGRYQDALARIYFIERRPSQPTVAACICTGLQGVVIPVGSIAVAQDGNQYTATSTGIIGPLGTVTISFACSAVGPIACPAGSLNEIYQSIPGWDTIANPDDGVLGNYVEGRAAFEQRRGLSVAQNALGTLPAIEGAVLSVPNVIDAFVTENDSNTASLVGGVLLNPNSIYVAVVGGDAAAVAQAIWSRKAPGCAYNGNTHVTVLDQSSGYSPPYPAYDVAFEIPDALDIVFSVVIQNSPLVPSDAVSQIQTAIIGAFAGLDGRPRAKIGTEVLASRYYCTIAALGAWAQIISLEIGSTNNPSAVFTGSITGNVLTVAILTSGSIAVGQMMMDDSGSLVAGTTVASFGTGIGGVGTYFVNIVQSLASETITSVTANLFKIPVRIDQVPTTSAPNISVILGN